MSVTVLNTTASLSGKTLQKLEDSQTVVGLKTFDRGASAPFGCVSGAGLVTHLDADKLDGQEGSYYAGTSFLWTPTLTAVTPGDLNVVYSVRIGKGITNGNKTCLTGNITTSTFTHTTAASTLIITGQPSAAAAGIACLGSASFSGVTKANYTHLASRIQASAAFIQFDICGSAQALAALAITDLPTGGTVQINFQIEFYL